MQIALSQQIGNEAADASRCAPALHALRIALPTLDVSEMEQPRNGKKESFKAHSQRSTSIGRSSGGTNSEDGTVRTHNAGRQYDGAEEARTAKMEQCALATLYVVTTE